MALVNFWTARANTTPALWEGLRITLFAAIFMGAPTVCSGSGPILAPSAQNGTVDEFHLFFTMVVLLACLPQANYRLNTRTPES